MPCAVQQLPVSGSPHSGRGHGPEGDEQSSERFTWDTQKSSQANSQQNGSAAQIAAQQRWSLQKGVSRSSQQDPAQPSPHELTQSHDAIPRANLTQSESHVSLQHWGRIAQTASQHARFSHRGLSFASQQRPAFQSPHSVGVQRPSPSGASQPLTDSPVARATQQTSQLTSQQNGSAAQTVAQQVRSEQAGIACDEKQDPLSGIPQSPEHRSLAVDAHAASQREPQQNGSIEQTASQQPGSLQKGWSWGWKHGPEQAFPQSTSPQQVIRARLTHAWSQATSQHSGIVKQTPAQHAGSSQPPFACALKQLPMHGHGSDGSGLHRSFAIETQLTSHRSMQQAGSTEQTTLQQVGSSHPGLACEMKHSWVPGQLSSPKQIDLA